MYAALFDSLRSVDLRWLVAGITLPNEDSVAPHLGSGFEEVDVFSEVGRRFDRYWDVLWMERPLMFE